MLAECIACSLFIPFGRTCSGKVDYVGAHATPYEIRFGVSIRPKVQMTEKRAGEIAFRLHGSEAVFDQDALDVTEPTVQLHQWKAAPDPNRIFLDKGLEVRALLASRHLAVAIRAYRQTLIVLFDLRGRQHARLASMYSRTFPGVISGVYLPRSIDDQMPAIRLPGMPSMSPKVTTRRSPLGW